MPCRPIIDPITGKVTGIECSRKGFRKDEKEYCYCGRKAVAYCDAPNTHSIKTWLGVLSTCDAPLCEEHRHKIDIDTDVCPQHNNEVSIKLAKKNRNDLKALGWEIPEHYCGLKTKKEGDNNEPVQITFSD
jgi:hypothetical protein